LISICQSAIKLHTFADAQDRAANFNKNVVKAFYTAGHLIDVLAVFGDIDDAMAAMGKYDKWKATYIHNCLKNGETPVPGPPGGVQPDVSSPPPQPDPISSAPPQAAPMEQPSSSSVGDVTAAVAGVSVSEKQYMEAAKYAKYAISAMQYEDHTSAVDNLHKALQILGAR